MTDLTFVPTEDGSLTLRIGQGESLSEAMHSLKGAFSETDYIYGSAIRTCLENGFVPRVLSMGLGLGYVEIMAAALFVKFGVTPERCGGESFEIIPELRERFQSWVLEKPVDRIEFREAYDSILARTAEHVGADPHDVRGLLKSMIEQERWKIREALGPETRFGERFGCICFDAFSSKTSPDLWIEEFLQSFLERACDSSCVLSTYACTGSMKRSLKEAGFIVTIRPGFAGKRDSTFAVRQPKD